MEKIRTAEDINSPPKAIYANKAAEVSVSAAIVNANVIVYCLLYSLLKNDLHK